MKKSVLIIESGSGLNALFQTVPDGANYRLFNEENGKQGFEAAKKYHPDMIFLDEKMADSNGVETFSDLKSNFETERIPVVYFTEKEPEAVRAQLGSNGATEILQKPVKLDSFLACLKRVDSLENNGMEAGNDIDILVAEDDIISRRMVESLLKKSGYTNLRLAVDGQQVMDQFAEKTPELLILDYMMPRKNGFQVLEEIRKNPKFKHIPIVFLTAVDDKSKLIEALNAGATDYITKPFDRAELLARVHAHARNYFLQKKVRETNKKLESLNKELQRKNDQIQADLQSAKKIQEALLPKEFSQCKNLDVQFYYQASNTVGGDFINIFKIDGNRVGFYIADVSGHGVTSALVTVFIREQINNILKKLDSTKLTPAKILRQLNKNFNKEDFFMENGIYLTIFCGFIDLNNYQLYYASAGHHALPLIIESNGNITELDDLGVAIGFMDDFEYENSEIKLDHNQRIFLHTDGIIEMANENNELFGMNRLKNFLKQNTGSNGNEVLENLVKDALAFSTSSEPQDDIALILLDIK